MIDVDSWDENDLDEIAAEIASRGNFYLAISNPCIEFWFYLHLADNKPFGTRRKIIRELKTLLGSYEKGDFDASLLAKQVHVAIRRAEALDKWQHPWSKTQGTQVYRLMKKILLS